MHAHKHKFQAFTLIEMMLVVVVMATFALMIAAFMKQQKQQNDTSTTAQDMQHISQVAQAYYVANGCWPQSIDNIIQSGLNSCGRFKMLSTNTACPSTNSYSLGYVGGQACSSSPSAIASALTVQTTVPTAAIAEQLANLLPMSSNPTPTMVQTTSPQPGNPRTLESLDDQMNDNAMTAVKSIYTDVIQPTYKGNAILDDNNIGNKNNRQSVTLPNCPSGWSSDFDVAISQSYVGRGSAAKLTRSVSLCKSSPTANPRYYVAKVDRVGAPDNYIIVATVITYCRSPKAKEDPNFIGRYTGWGSFTTADQCPFASGKVS